MALLKPDPEEVAEEIHDHLTEYEFEEDKLYLWTLPSGWNEHDVKQFTEVAHDGAEHLSGGHLFVQENFDIEELSDEDRAHFCRGLE